MNADLLDRVNRAWYAEPGSVAGMAAQCGFTDEGERAAYRLLAHEMHQRPILDLGVGPGRTVDLLQSLSTDYVGIDYLPAMVEAARANHPQADIRLGDARDLGDFASESKALVVFSYHGIDSVSHEDRLRVLAEAWRVLVPGGTFWFSTLNASGPAARYRPWLPLVPPADDRPGAWLRHTLQWAGALARVPTHTTRYWHGRALLEAGTGWAVAPFFAGGWRLVTHYTTLPELQREVADSGFAANPAVFEDAHGHRVGVTDDLRPVFGFNVLARKPRPRMAPD
ncbi:MAG TPA: class I SAM-dependent methyltransferase [Ideonella sp.]|uniref:class I SAM-dependent methyltransferase n=1 Tax=Ideonella sp. TaxID=1929293 RepID=UPI002E2F0E39|nr:class I SAM-dependent methyltransferase [Ideonella sp.]HEX5685890.1 class I SAM-dependent methyltransferase [Ideonella sp.]